MITYSWSQTTKTFGSSGTFAVPSGVTSISVQAWGGGGSGGGASGAPLLLGRGAAGGGGGAYASGPVSVTSGTTLNVVVAGLTAGTTGTGTAGGNSTITGFESSILAAGGSGGAANNAGGTPVGGAGGTTAASAGTTKLAGGNGGNGNSWNLLGLLLSSGPGGAGANNGGAGGAAVSGLILSNAPGNAGSTPGGAGSGAINSALGAPYAGGAGAAGQVIISYTCPTYSITSTTATNVCSTSGTTATVTLTSGAGALPVGNYVVTYNRSSPNATALTANVVVTTAGTGTFTATGLSTAGSSTITITKLTSETCSSNITTNNTATITIAPATVGGTVSGGTSICAGNTSGVLTLSGNVGTVVKWQFAVSPFSTWTDVSNPTTANTYTSVPLTATTQFRAVITGICGTTNSGTTTVTVNRLPAATLTKDSFDICFQDNSSGTHILGTFDSIINSPTTYSIVWNSSPSNNFVPITDASLSGSNFNFDFYVPAGLAVGTYTGTITVKNAAGCVSLGAPLIINIKESSTIATSGNIASVCKTGTTQNASLTYSASTGSPTQYSIDWDSTANSALLTDQGITSFNFASGGGIVNNIQVPANVASGTYSGTLLLIGGTCQASQPVTITVSSPPTITFANSSTVNVCYGGNTTGYLLFIDEVTGSPATYSIVWNSSPANNLQGVTDAPFPQNSIGFSIPSQLAVGTYTGTLTVKNANGCVSSGTVITINVNDTPTINTAGTINPIFTSSSPQIATLEYSQVTGALPETYNIDWDAAANTALLQDQPNTAWTFEPIGDIINTIAISANVPPGTYHGTMFLNTSTCTGSVPVSIVISDPAPTIQLAANAGGICTDVDGTDQNSILGYAETTGDPVSYSIVWSTTPANNLTNITDETLYGSPIVIIVPLATAAGIYTGTLTVKNENGIVSTGYNFSLNVRQSTKITSTGVVDGVSVSPNSQNTTLSYSTATGNPTKYFIDWNNAANAALLEDQNDTLFSFAANGGIINNIVIPANVPAGTYSGTISILGESQSCSYDTAISIVISSPVPTINLAKTAATVCSDTNESTTTLSYSATTGGPVTYSIVWDSSPANNFAYVIDESLPASPIIISIPAGTAPQTYTGNLVVKSVDNVSSNHIFLLKIIQCDGINSTGITDPLSAKNIVAGTSPNQVDSTSTTDSASAENPVVVSVLNKVIDINTFNENIDKVFIYDVSGTLIYKKDSVENPSLVIDNLRSGNQVLVVKVLLKNSTSKTKKIIY
jgi:hypothetical protein